MVILLSLLLLLLLRCDSKVRNETIGLLFLTAAPVNTGRKKWLQTNLREPFLSADMSDSDPINPLRGASCPGPSLVSHQSRVTPQIVSQGALWVVGDEEKAGKDGTVDPNCYRFNCLNILSAEA